jgi:hypothetical protein
MIDNDLAISTTVSQRRDRRPRKIEPIARDTKGLDSSGNTGVVQAETTQARKDRETRKPAMTSSNAKRFGPSSVLPLSSRRLLGGQAYDQPFENQPRRHRAFAFQIEISLQEPAVKLAAALPAQQPKLPLGPL